VDNQDTMLKHFLNPPNWFTFASIFCGFSSIMTSANTSDPNAFYQAGLLIVFAGIFDMLDGRVARLTGRGSEFGVQLDSLADVVSFGVAPAVLVYSWGLHQLGPVGMTTAFIFVLCGIMRLARFNTLATGEEKTLSRGLTITSGGGMIAATVMAHAALGRESVANPVNVMLMVMGLSILMLSQVPYRLFAKVRRSKGVVAFVASLLAAGIITGIRFDIALFLFAFGTAYIASGPLILLGDFRKSRRASSHGIEVEIEIDEDE
jgi:CDP-diacylglycerol--serine O-phosphatidyltransferase